LQKLHQIVAICLCQIDKSTDTNGCHVLCR
jgi:hypothetical protein